MKIPFVDLKTQYRNNKDEIDSAIMNVIENTAFIGGKPVNEFEKKFAEKYGVKHCISCANGTDSLYILYKMLGIGAGDEVILPANTWISTGETISQAGARPVFVDFEPDYYTIDPDKIEEKITSKTKAIVPVHLYGQMCDMDRIMEIARKHKLFVIEDCAQSHFSEYKGKRAGLFGIAGSFSFYPGKNLGAYGDAGCIITNDDELAKKCKLFARHGALTKHKHEIEGINSRMDGIHAAVLSVKLDHIDQWTEQRIANAKVYDRLFEGNPSVIIPKSRPGTKHTYHLYVIRVKNRERLQHFLEGEGIETSIHYPVPLPYMEAYNYLGHQPGDFPVSYEFKDEILSIPMFPELTEEQMNYVAGKIELFCEKELVS